MSVIDSKTIARKFPQPRNFHRNNTLIGTLIFEKVTKSSASALWSFPTVKFYRSDISKNYTPLCNNELYQPCNTYIQLVIRIANLAYSKMITAIYIGSFFHTSVTESTRHQCDVQTKWTGGPQINITFINLHTKPRLRITFYSKSQFQARRSIDSQQTGKQWSRRVKAIDITSGEQRVFADSREYNNRRWSDR